MTAVSRRVIFQRVIYRRVLAIACLIRVLYAPDASGARAEPCQES